MKTLGHPTIFVTVLVALVLGGSACSSASHPAELGTVEALTSTDRGYSGYEVSKGGDRSGACDIPGETADCFVELPRHGTVANCFHGVQTCANGQWGPCGALRAGAGPDAGVGADTADARAGSGEDASAFVEPARTAR